MGTTALVIGASSQGGLGQAVVRRLSADGVQVAVAGRNMPRLVALAEEIGGVAVFCDMEDEDSIAAALTQAGPLDLLVNAAGTADALPIAKLTRARIERQLSIHVTANMLMLKHATQHVRHGGSIVLFSSVTAQVPGVGLAAYACAKAALEHLVRVAAVEFSSLGIRVNAVAPGFSPTPMTEAIFAAPHLRDLYLRESLIDARAVLPDEVAAAVAWLADPRCFTTGDIINMSGGAQLGRLPRMDEIRQARNG